MKNTIITSIQNLLQKLEEQGNQPDLPKLSFHDLEKYSEEELRAIEVFLQKSLESMTNYFREYGNLLQSVNAEYEKSSDEILRNEKAMNDQKKVDEIQASLKRK